MIRHLICALATTVSLLSSSEIIDASYQNGRIRAAGTLSYAQNPEDGKIYVLLAKEAVWEGPSSGKWKGFGGKREANETIFETAIRETLEESRNMICYSIDEIPFDQLITVAHYHHKYLQIMLPIEYDPEIPRRFHLVEVEDRHYLEKTEIRWVLLEDLMQAVQKVEQLSREKNVSPCKVPVSLHMMGEELPLAGDFIETMAIILREAPQAITSIMKDGRVPHAIVVSDENWNTVEKK